MASYKDVGLKGQSENKSSLKYKMYTSMGCNEFIFWIIW